MMVVDHKGRISYATTKLGAMLVGGKQSEYSSLVFMHMCFTVLAVYRYPWRKRCWQAVARGCRCTSPFLNLPSQGYSAKQLAGQNLLTIVPQPFSLLVPGIMRVCTYCRCLVFSCYLLPGCAVVLVIGCST